MKQSAFLVFLTAVLSVWAAMHAYVFWRLSSLQWVATRFSERTLCLAAIALWASYPIARMLSARAPRSLGWPVEYAAASWIGILFLLFSAFLLVDVLTAGGLFFPTQAALWRPWAAVAALVLALIALAQGLREPVLRDYEVIVQGLPQKELTVVALTDLHLGRLIGKRWTARLVQRAERLRPDLVLVGGDLVDGEVDRVEPLIPTLSKLQAPLGVWAVTGNHEFYAGVEASIALFKKCGFHVLRDQSAQLLPGLVLAGVDDLTARRDFGHDTHTPVEKALTARPPGATILLSHSPLQAQLAAQLGVNLMISGHTHHGQIWPFSRLVALRYQFLGGRYEVGPMSVIVSRGAGTWGPRMRLWHPSEIVRIRLRAAE